MPNDEINMVLKQCLVIHRFSRLKPRVSILMEPQNIKQCIFIDSYQDLKRLSNESHGVMKELRTVCSKVSSYLTTSNLYLKGGTHSEKGEKYKKCVFGFWLFLKTYFFKIFSYIFCNQQE